MIGLEKLFFLEIACKDIPVTARAGLALAKEDRLDALLYLLQFAGLGEAACVAMPERLWVLGVADHEDSLSRARAWLGQPEGGGAAAAWTGRDAVSRFVRSVAVLEGGGLERVAEACRFASEHGGARRTLGALFNLALGAARTIQDEIEEAEVWAVLAAERWCDEAETARVSVR